MCQHGRAGNTDTPIDRATCTSIEPGIYLPRFGIRSEVTFISANARRASLELCIRNLAAARLGSFCARLSECSHKMTDQAENVVVSAPDKPEPPLSDRVQVGRPGPRHGAPEDVGTRGNVFCLVGVWSSWAGDAGNLFGSEGGDAFAALIFRYLGTGSFYWLRNT